MHVAHNNNGSSCSEVTIVNDAGPSVTGKGTTYGTSTRTHLTSDHGHIY